MSTFRAIIVGGGLTGLFTAHVLSLADIPFVVLERRASPTVEPGAVVALLPQSFRLFDQLGLLDDVLKLEWGRLKLHVRCKPGGKVASVTKSFARFEEKYVSESAGSDYPHPLRRSSHGHAMRWFTKQSLIDLLWDRLPDREKRVFPAKDVVDIET